MFLFLSIAEEKESNSLQCFTEHLQQVQKFIISQPRNYFNV
jgi:hypothetical protein